MYCENCTLQNQINKTQQQQQQPTVQYETSDMRFRAPTKPSRTMKTMP